MHAWVTSRTNIPEQSADSPHGTSWTKLTVKTPRLSVSVISDVQSKSKNTRAREPIDFKLKKNRITKFSEPKKWRGPERIEGRDVSS